MNIRHYIALLALCALTVSCEVKFPLEDTGATPKIYISSFPGNNTLDTLVVRIANTIPVSSSANVSPEKFNPQVNLKINGQDVMLERYNAMNYSHSLIPHNSLYAAYKVKPGDELELSASAPGYESVHSTAVIPKEFPEVKVNFSEDDNNNTVKAVATFTDDGQTKDYYGAQLVVDQTLTFHYGNHFEWTVFTRYFPWMYDGKDETVTGISGEEFMDVNFDGIKYGSVWYNPTTAITRCWNDYHFQGKTKTITIETKMFEDTHFPNPSDKDNECIQYKLLLYRFSDEMYRYFTMMDQINNNDFAHWGLAPSGFTYTNIEGGLGIFAGYHVKEILLKEEHFENGVPVD